MTQIRLDVPITTILVVWLIGSVFVWWLYRRQCLLVRERWLATVLPIMRCAALLILLLTLAQPNLESRTQVGDPSRLAFLVDGSRSMSLVDTASTAASSRRYDLATRLLNAPNGFLERLKPDSRLVVARTAGSRDEANSVTVLWSSDPLEPSELPQSYVAADRLATGSSDSKTPSAASAWRPANWSNATSLGDATSELLQSIAPRSTADGAKGTSDRPTAALVLLTDGQVNAGEDLLAVSQRAADLGIPIHVVAFGPERQPSDVAVLRIDAPESVFQSERLRGSLVLQDELPPGTEFLAKIEVSGTVLWQQSLRGEGRGERHVDFSFAIPDERKPNGSLSAIPVAENASLLNLLAVVELGPFSSDVVEATVENNSQRLTTRVINHPAQVLLLDGRSRWETRYLKNLFERDPGWELKHAILRPSIAQTASDQLGWNGESLPDLSSLAALSQHQLIVLGEVNAAVLPDGFLAALNDYVEQGGGLVVIDGQRQTLWGKAHAALTELLPVELRGNQNVLEAAAASPIADERRSSAAWDAPMRMRLTMAARDLDAFQIADQAESGSVPGNQGLWDDLPALQFVAQVDLRPGAEMLVEASNELETRPLMVTRRFGAGRVLYLASDETWRWRYSVGDKVHGRLWNQLAQWVQRRVPAVQSEFASIDTNRSNYAEGDAVEVSCELQIPNDNSNEARTVFAVAVDSADREIRLPMTASGDGAGRYQASLTDLPAGDYRLRLEAAGVPPSALAIESQFSVTADGSQELQRLTCNTNLLQDVANRTGGSFVRAAEAGELLERMRLSTTGQVVRSKMEIWQSYPWFLTAIGLLVIEWFLRKRYGLI